MMITVLSACKKQAEEAGEEPVLLSRDTLSEYVIVYGQNVSDELQSKVGELSLKFKDKFGIALSVKDDYYMVFEGGLSGFPVNHIFSREKNRLCFWLTFIFLYSIIYI